MFVIRTVVSATLRASAFCLLAAPLYLMAQAPKRVPKPNLSNPHVKMIRIAPVTTDKSAAPSQLAFIDPVTHQMRQPDPSEVSNLRNRAVKVQGATVVSPTGAIGVIADESTMSFLVATKSKVGKVSTACVDGKAKADAVVKNKQPIAPVGVFDVK